MQLHNFRQLYCSYRPTGAPAPANPGPSYLTCQNWGLWPGFEIYTYDKMLVGTSL